MTDTVCWCPSCAPDRSGESVEELWRIQCHVRHTDAGRILDLPFERRAASIESYTRREGTHRGKLLQDEVIRQYQAARKAQTEGAA